MSSPSGREEGNVLDAVWADLGVSLPGPGDAAPRTRALAARRVAGCLLFAAVVACGAVLPSSGWRAGVGLAVACAALAALGGALLAGRPLAGLIAGAVAGAGGVCAAAWASDPALAAVFTLAGLAPGACAYHPLCLLLGRRPPEVPCPAPAPLAIIYGPPPETPGPQEAALEERLLHLCRQDGRLLERLLGYERERHPGLRRAELLRLAIEHLEQDNR